MSEEHVKIAKTIGRIEASLLNVAWVGKANADELLITLGLVYSDLLAIIDRPEWAQHLEKKIDTLTQHSKAEK
jgi:hypothetical protein